MHKKADPGLKKRRGGSDPVVLKNMLLGVV
jgi:hypothetical protein